MSREQGREVSVLTSSAERALSFAKSPELKDRLLHRSRMLDGTFSLTPQSTVIVEGAEKLSLKEMLVLTGEAQGKFLAQTRREPVQKKCRNAGLQSSR